MKFFISIPMLLALSEIHKVDSSSECWEEHSRYYSGHVNVSANGNVCKTWWSKSYLIRTDAYFPDGVGTDGEKAAANYCRNPHNNTCGPWCFVEPWGWEYCDVPECFAANCDDGVQNQCETGLDCGGTCPKCATCDDEVQNQGEDDIDCGGPCKACPTCDDGTQNQGETGVDCGGPCNTYCQDACDKFDGKPFRYGLSSKAVCCNKDCPKCGGNRCGYQKDTSGKKLKRDDCCGRAILANGEKCGSNGREAPCKL